MCNRCVEWGGKRWHRYGEDSGSYYERTDKSVRPKRTIRLHREVWAAINGPIPVGYDIHHLDGDKCNNQPKNLVCITRSEHSRHHLRERPMRCAWGVKSAILVKCTKCGCDLQRKRVGKPSCKRCAEKSAEQNRKRTRTCRFCAVSFVTRRGNYCSQRCVNLATRGGTISVLPQGSG